MNTYKTILYILFLSISVNSFAQIGKIEKANLKYDKYNYIDAREIYLKVVEKGYRSVEIYRKLGDTYYFNSEYSGAAKWYYALINEFPNQATATDYFRASQCFKSINQEEEAENFLKLYRQKGGKALTIGTNTDVADTLFEKGVNDKLFEIEKVSINTKFSDFGPAFYGNSIVYASGENIEAPVDDNKTDLAGWDNQPFLDLYQADLNDTLELENPRPLKGDVNTKYHESTAVFSKNGNTMYFTRNNYYQGKKGKDKDNVIRLKIFKATKIGDVWTNIKELPFNNDSYSVGHPALNNEENRLYFASDMPGTLGMSDLWYVDILGEDIYSKPVNLGPTINTSARETFPFISKENNLYFSSDGYNGMGGLDIYITKLTGDTHGDISTFKSPLNSPNDDFSFIINENERLGFFASNRDGETGSKSDDIYKFQERCEINIHGLVTDEDTGELLPGTKLTLLNSNNKQLQTATVNEDATYSFFLDCKKQYIIKAKKEGYYPKELIIKTPNKTEDIDMPIKLKWADPCRPDDLGCRLSLQPIYFDFDKSNIRPDAEIELAKILEALNEYPKLKIHIESHTDSRGNDQYNLKLSERRALSTLNWFYNHGVDKNRLTSKGYGESQLLNRCKNNVECTEEEHQLNRRSMFIILD